LAAAAPSALAKVATADLPEEMQRMSPEERSRFVEQKRQERESVLSQIKVESAKREATLKAAPKPSKDAFDSKVMDSLKKAGADKGIGF
jgi:hypothetical protein